MIAASLTSPWVFLSAGLLQDLTAFLPRVSASNYQSYTSQVIMIVFIVNSSFESLNARNLT